LALDVVPVHHVGVAATRIAHLIGAHGADRRSVGGVVGVGGLGCAVVHGVVLAEEFVVDGGHGGRRVDTDRDGVEGCLGVERK
jgi:hypothetical protein